MKKQDLKEGMKVNCSDYNTGAPLYVINLMKKEPKFVGVSWKKDCPKDYEFVVNIDKLSVWKQLRFLIKKII